MMKHWGMISALTIAGATAQTTTCPPQARCAPSAPVGVQLPQRGAPAQPQTSACASGCARTYDDVLRERVHAATTPDRRRMAANEHAWVGIIACPAQAEFSRAETILNAYHTNAGLATVISEHGVIDGTACYLPQETVLDDDYTIGVTPRIGEYVGILSLRDPEALATPYAILPTSGITGVARASRLPLYDGQGADTLVVASRRIADILPGRAHFANGTLIGADAVRASADQPSILEVRLAHYDGNRLSGDAKDYYALRFEIGAP